MKQSFDPVQNYRHAMEVVGYVSPKEATRELYEKMGFKSGLEIHQQLKTGKKLFCRCPAGLYQKDGEYDAEVVRHMRPTLSEMGEYDGTALMERKTKKNIFYHIKNETACTYDIDDTPPFKINPEALEISVEIALLLKTNIVSELHITRKQYLDGSIPTGFQRTGIVGIEGEIPISNKTIRIIQLSIEEDACREVSDVGHDRVYTTDRLGMPLIETVTYPDMTTPDEVAEAGQYLRFLARSTGNVRTGIGAGREDVNVSITGSTRIEIKGVSRIRWIPLLTHNEAFRQKALLEIKKHIDKEIKEPNKWRVKAKDISFDDIPIDYTPLTEAKRQNRRLTIINLPGFKGVLSFFTQPGKMFADELSDRLKVIACLERPNILHSEMLSPVISKESWELLADSVEAGKNDAQIIVWGPSDDITTAIDTIEERCRLAFEGVPNETRKALPGGITIFERVLPGPDRMYPDTDSAPIPIDEKMIEEKNQNLPVAVSERIKQLRQWKIPEDTFHYLLRNNLVGLIEKIVAGCGVDAKYVGTLLGHTLKHIEGKFSLMVDFSYNKVYGLLKFLIDKKIHIEIAGEMLPVLYQHPNMAFESILTTIGYHPNSIKQLLDDVPLLQEKFQQINSSRKPDACLRWIMGNMRNKALGNIPLRELKDKAERAVSND